MRLTQFSPRLRQFLNGSVIVGSILLCLFLSLMRLPGMELLGIGPDWLLIWLVTWSMKRTVSQGVIAGLSLGLIQDGLTSSYPSHVLVLVLVGFLTARLHKQRYIKEELIAVVLIVFVLTLLAEMLIALQYGLQGVRPWEDIWLDYQRIALSSALLSSLWTPVLYYPLQQWWEKIRSINPVT